MTGHLAQWLLDHGASVQAYQAPSLLVWLATMSDGSTLATRGIQTRGLGHGMDLLTWDLWASPGVPGLRVFPSPCSVDKALGVLHQLDVIWSSHPDPRPDAIFVTSCERDEVAKPREPGAGWPSQKHWVWGKGPRYHEAVGS